MAGRTPKAATVTRKTKKRKVEILLPGTQTVVYQSNRVTNARYEFTLMQLRVFLYVMKSLQDAIKKSMDGKDWEQLVLFADDAQSLVNIPIPLADITEPDQYKDVIQAAEQMKQLSIKFKSTEREGYIDHAGLFAMVSVPEKVKGGKQLYVTMLKQVATHLVTIDKNEKGLPVKYTKFLYEVAFNASSKYTVLLYIKISSWKQKGGFVTTLQELKKDLGMDESEYPNYFDFKKRVLLPAQDELSNKADCWFNCAEKGFEVKEGRKVVKLNFKVITPELEDINRNKAFTLRDMLRRELGFKDEHINCVEPILKGHLDYEKIVLKVYHLVQHLKENGASINDPQKYAVTSLLNEFPD